ncbi:MAG: adenylate/guanylate cyclase domain-containing protein [Candidatus Eisenbacteria sp.]|nr:adenylate/guanylate cyclase domain-containing protein [Candidatus Eisenbacteria bacterium]
MRKSSSGYRALIGVLIGIAAAVAVIILTEHLFLKSTFDGFEAGSYDLRFRYRAERFKIHSIDDVIIIDIDQRSLYNLGRIYQWPRWYHAQVIDFVASGGASAIGFDIIFDPDRERTADDLLIESTRAAGIVHHAISLSPADSLNWLPRMESEPEGLEVGSRVYDFPPQVREHFLTLERFDNELVDLLNASRGTGFVNVEPDPDGVVRRMRLFINFNDHTYPSLGFGIALARLGVDPADLEVNPGKGVSFWATDPGDSVRTRYCIPIDDEGRVYIDYQGKFNTFRYIPYYDVYKKRLPAEIFKDKIVLVGSSLHALADLKSVPVQELFPGVEIQANLIYSILHRSSVRVVGGVGSVALVLGLGLLVGVVCLTERFRSLIVSSLFLTVVMTGYILIAFRLFLGWSIPSLGILGEPGMTIPMVRPLVTMGLAFLMVVSYRYQTEERAKRQMRGYFAQYVDEKVVDEITRSPGKIRLGGEKREVTLLFSDIRYFTTMSERMPPEEVARFLNRYLTVMTSIVTHHGGMLDKYIGDAIVAVFGAPLPNPNHARDACLAGVEMIEKLEELRDGEEPPWNRLNIGIGINTGEATVGNMGSDYLFDYTAIGDNVNLASRLEGLNKFYETQVLVSERTYRSAGEGISARELDLIAVKGRQASVRVYQLLAGKRTREGTGATASMFHNGLEAYRRREWDIAVSEFEKVLDIEGGGPSRVLFSRCRVFRENPPEDDWDGSWRMDEK